MAQASSTTAGDLLNRPRRAAWRWLAARFRFRTAPIFLDRRNTPGIHGIHVTRTTGVDPADTGFFTENTPKPLDVPPLSSGMGTWPLYWW